MHEVLKQLQWKKHREKLHLRPALRDNVAFELADVTKYLFSLWQYLGFDLDEMLEAVQAKSEVVWGRYLQEHRTLEEKQPVLLVDLDGTVADFQQGMLKYLSDSGLPLPPEIVADTLSVERLAGIGYPQYWDLKRSFEESGGYGTLPHYPDAVQFIQEKAEQGWAIIVATARPSHIARSWRDSYLWLRKLGIDPTRLEMLEADRCLLAQYYLQRGHPVVALEDDPSHAQRLAGVCPVLLRAHPYNIFPESLTTDYPIYRMDTFEDVARRISDMAHPGILEMSIGSRER